jgi:hypothetical protein
VLSPEGVRRVLSGSPEPFAVANREKRGALSHFQPHGVLVSHGQLRADRRRVNQEVLDSHRPVHRLAEAIAAKVLEEARPLLPGGSSRSLSWDEFAVAWWHMVRRVVLGDAARNDHELTDLLAKLRAAANWSSLRPQRPRVRARFLQRLGAYLDEPEPGSLAELVAGAPSPAGTDPGGQVPQWLFAFDATGMATFRTLALPATHPAQLDRVHSELAGKDLSAPQDLAYLRSCVQESVRLWPTTPAILRDTTTDTTWDSRVLPQGPPWSSSPRSSTATSGGYPTPTSSRPRSGWTAGHRTAGRWSPSAPARSSAPAATWPCWWPAHSWLLCWSGTSSA